MPRKAARLIGVSLLGLAGVFIVVAAAGFGFRAYRQHLSAETLAIRSPNGVQEGAFVDIGGIKQWIQIRGEDRDNPVLLFVHGGPGGSTLGNFVGLAPLGKAFHRGAVGPARRRPHLWHRRRRARANHDAGANDAGWRRAGRISAGASAQGQNCPGRTFLGLVSGHSHREATPRSVLCLCRHGTGGRQGDVREAFAITITRLQGLAQSANNREARGGIGADRITAADQSAKSPGCGQMEQSTGAAAHRGFQLAGPVPPLFMPDVSLLDWYNWQKGAAFSAKYLSGRTGPMFQSDMASIGFEFSIPMFFIQGDADGVTPGEPAEQLFQRDHGPA